MKRRVASGTVRLGKGQRDRLVPLTETAAYWLIRYLTAARPELAAGKLWGKGKRRNKPEIIPPTSALWLSVTSRRLSYQMIADRIRNYASQAEVKASVHTLPMARFSGGLPTAIRAGTSLIPATWRR